MDTIGLDLHQRESQLCILASGGTATERRIVTSRERLTAALGDRPAARLVEARTEREWVARHLEALGHDVIVADPPSSPTRRWQANDGRVRGSRKSDRGATHSELIVKVPAWSEGTPVADAKKP